MNPCLLGLEVDQGFYEIEPSFSNYVSDYIVTIPSNVLDVEIKATKGESANWTDDPDFDSQYPAYIMAEKHFTGGTTSDEGVGRYSLMDDLYMMLHVDENLDYAIVRIKINKDGNVTEYSLRINFEE